MDNKKRKILAVAVIVIGAALIIFFAVRLFNSPDGTPEPGDQTPVIEGQIDDSSLPTPGDRPNIDYSRYDISQEQPHKIDREDLAKQAMFFAERLGSFSNQSDYGNIDDLMMFMTESMQVWAEDYIEDLRASNGATEYYGISTNAITATVNSFNEEAGEAEISVATKRQELKGTQENSFDQSLKVLLVKADGDWKIDGAYWEK